MVFPNTIGSQDGIIGWNQLVIQVGRDIRRSVVQCPAPQI